MLCSILCFSGNVDAMLTCTRLKCMLTGIHVAQHADGAMAADGASARPSASALEAFLDSAADPLAGGAGRSDYARRATVGNRHALFVVCRCVRSWL